MLCAPMQARLTPTPQLPCCSLAQARFKLVPRVLTEEERGPCELCCERGWPHLGVEGSSSALSIRFRQLRANFEVFYTLNNKNGSWRALYKNKECRRKLYLSCMSGDFRESYHNTLRSHVSYQTF